MSLSAKLLLGMLSFFWRNGVETPEPLKADVTGSIPPWLQGTLLRNGPGLFSVGNTSYKHWFDGMALIHSFTFKDGDVFYRSKFLKSETFKKNIAANRIVVSEFGTMVYPDPCKNIFSKAFSYLLNAIPDFTDNNLINIIRYGEDYYASSEVNYINKIDPMTLETLGRTNYRNHIAINLATAHPHYDDEGNTYNMGTAIMNYGRPKYVIFKVPANASGSPRNIYHSLDHVKFLRPVHSKNDNYKDNYISVPIHALYHSVYYKHALQFCRLPLQTLKLFKAGWILIGCQSFISWKKMILFLCAVIIKVVVWTLLFFYIYNNFKNYICNVVVIVLGVNRTLSLFLFYIFKFLNGTKHLSQLLYEYKNCRHV